VKLLGLSEALQRIPPGPCGGSFRPVTRPDNVGVTLTWAWSRDLSGPGVVAVWLSGDVQAARKNTPPEWSWQAHLTGVPEPLQRLLVAYLECCMGTRTRSTVSHLASRLAHFGRFVAELDPTLASWAELDRQRHIEPWLHAVAAARHRHYDTPLSASERRSRILAVGRMLQDITDWGWARPAAGCSPARTSPDCPAPCRATCPRTPTGG
jgi:hypothetical protein